MIEKVSVLGAGTMGGGIAELFSTKGISVTLYDPNNHTLEACREKFGTHLDLACTSNLNEAVVGADLVIECAPEDLALKRRLYSEISKKVKSNCIVASNTSTFPLAALSAGQPFANRMIIAHFFNPGQIVPLVELVKLDHTEPDVIGDVSDFLRQAGKVPVILKKDIPGFIANRLQAAVLREACYLVGQGVAEPSDIDTVMRESIGIRWALNGPFEIADFGGLDIWEKVLKNLMPVLDNSSDVPAMISEKVQNQNLGFKSGKGFYLHDITAAGEMAEIRTEMLKRILSVKQPDSQR